MKKVVLLLLNNLHPFGKLSTSQWVGPCPLGPTRSLHCPTLLIKILPDVLPYSQKYDLCKMVLCHYFIFIVDVSFFLLQKHTTAAFLTIMTVLPPTMLYLFLFVTNLFEVVL